MLAAIPVYLMIGDGGFATAASNDMAMRSGACDRARALTVFQSTAVLLGLVSLAVLAGALALVQLTPLSNWFGFQEIGDEELRMVLLLLVVHVLVGFQGGLLNGGFWCSGRYPLGMTLASTTQLIEFAALAAAVALGGGPVQAALAYLAGRVLGTLLTRVALKRATPWLRYGLAKASLQEIRRLAAPAFASLAFPLGNALNIQGMRLVVGLALGPAAVVVFAALRTLSNFATQPRAVVNRLIEPELGLAFGAGDKELFSRLFLRGCQAALWLCLLVAVTLLLIGPWLWPIWTQGEVEMHWLLFLILLTAAVANSIWYTALMVPYATNRHGRIAVIYIAVYGAGALAAGYLGAVVAGLPGAAAGLLVAETVIAVYVLPVALRMAQQHWGSWFSTTMRPPSVALLRRRIFIRGSAEGQDEFRPANQTIPRSEPKLEPKLEPNHERRR
jgi:O-antigen/teichoic acid export membrane protein